MAVVLPCCLVEGPGSAAEAARPIVGRSAAGGRVAPQVPVAFRVVAAGPAFSKPGMPLGRMVRHEIEDDLQATPVCRLHQRVEIRQGPEHRVDAAVIRYVVAEIGHRRGVHWRNPDRVDSQLHQVVEAACDAVQIADAVAVAVLERPWVDLVDDAALPPACGGNHLRHRRIQRLCHVVGCCIAGKDANRLAIGGDQIDVG